MFLNIFLYYELDWNEGFLKREVSVTPYLDISKPLPQSMVDVWIFPHGSGHCRSTALSRLYVSVERLMSTE